MFVGKCISISKSWIQIILVLVFILSRYWLKSFILSCLLDPIEGYWDYLCLGVIWNLVVISDYLYHNWDYWSVYLYLASWIHGS
jgi:hypothetical protein